MNLQQLSINDLKPAPYNPRLKLAPGDPAWEKLARSLDEFELVQPVVWNERTGHIVSGHQRLEVLRQRGETLIDCVVVDLPLEKEKALNVTLNNASVGSDWDSAKLTDLLEDLQDLPDFDATLTGFDEQQLRDLILAPDPVFLPDEDDEPQSHNVQVRLTIPNDSWDSARGYVDDLLSDHPGVSIHVQLPQS